MHSRIGNVAAVVIVAGLVAAAILVGGDRDEKPTDGAVAVPTQPSVPKRARLATAADSRAAVATEHVIAGHVTHLPPRAAARVETRRVDDCPARAHVTDMFDEFAPPPEAAQAVAAAPTTADGAFELKVAASGTYLVTAKLDGGGESSRRVNVPDVLPRVDVDIAAPSGGNTLRGRVVRADGAPFRGWVTIDDVNSSAAIAARVVAADGRFEVRGLSPMKARLTALVPGELATTFPEVEIPAADELVLTIPAGRLRHGRVVADPDGGPVAGAVVVSRTRNDERSAWIESRVVADADGAFIVREVKGLVVQVNADGFGPMAADAGADILDYRLARIATDEIVLRLHHQAIAGRVLRSSDGSPVAGAVVIASSRSYPNVFRRVATSAADGTYRIEGVGQGRCDVYVLGGGWASVALATWEDGHRGKAQENPFAVDVAPGATASCDLRVEPAARIEGTVLDPAGRPGRGAVIQLITWSDTKNGPAWTVPSVTWAGADGSFSFEGIPAGLGWNIEASSPGLPNAFEHAEPSAGETRKVELRFDAPQRIDVTVLSAATGGPVAMAAIDVVTLEDGNVSGTSSRGVTGDDGRCSLVDAPPGRLGVTVSAEGFVRIDDNRPFRATQDAADPNRWRAEVRLEPAFVISGRVLHADGRPVAKLDLQLTTTVDGNDVPFGGSQETGEDGSFRFDGLPAGTFCVTKWGEETKLTTVAAGAADVVVRLDDAGPGGGVKLTFVGPDGAPVPNARFVFKCGGCSFGAYAEDGMQRIPAEYCPSGEAVIAAWESRDAQRAPLPLGAAICVVPAPVPHTIEIRFPRERVAAGRIVGPDGRGVAGATILARFAEHDLTDEASTATSAADGSFELRQLGAGQFAVEVEPPKDFLAPKPFEIQGGQHDILINVPAAAVGVVTVRDWNGDPVRGALIDVRATKPAPSPDPRNADPGLLAHVVTGADGTARVNGIVPGTECAIVVLGPANRDDLATWSASPWTPHDVEVKLERAFAIRGVVVDAAGKGVPHATIWIATDSGKPAEVQSDDAGRFVIPRLRRGETRRLCGGGSYAYIVPAEPKWTTVAAGDADVRLTAQKSE